MANAWNSQKPYLLRYAAPVAMAGVAAPALGLAAAALTVPTLRLGQWAVHPADPFTRYATPAITALLIGMAISMGRLGAWYQRSGRRSALLLAVAWMAWAAFSSVQVLWDVFQLPSGFTKQERAVVDWVMDEIGPTDAVLASHFEIYGSYHVAYRISEGQGESPRFWEAFSVLPALSSRSRIYDYHQLPQVLDAAGKRRRQTLEEVLEDVQWCILCMPPPALQPRTREVRRALQRSGQFEQIAEAGSVQVFRRRPASPAQR